MVSSKHLESVCTYPDNKNIQSNLMGPRIPHISNKNTNHFLAILVRFVTTRTANPND